MHNTRYICTLNFGVDKELSNEECLAISKKALNEFDKILKEMGIPAEHNENCGIKLNKPHSYDDSDSFLGKLKG